MATTTKKVGSEEKVTTAPVNKTTKLTPAQRREQRESKKGLPKDKAKELDLKNVKDTVKTQVTSIREVKWKYPEDITGPLDRKQWRQKQRSHLKSLESAVGKAKDEPKALKKAELALKSFRKEVLMVP